MNSREKGARYERELSASLREYGYTTRRTAQYCGLSGDAADVIGLPGIHIEAKHYKNTGFSYDWLDQAKRDAKEGTIPAVFHRINGRKTVVTLELDDFMKLYNDTTLPDMKG